MKMVSVQVAGKVYGKHSNTILRLLKNGGLKGDKVGGTWRVCIPDDLVVPDLVIDGGKQVDLVPVVVPQDAPEDEDEDEEPDEAQTAQDDREKELDEGWNKLIDQQNIVTVQRLELKTAQDEVKDALKEVLDRKKECSKREQALLDLEDVTGRMRDAEALAEEITLYLGRVCVELPAAMHGDKNAMRAMQTVYRDIVPRFGEADQTRYFGIQWKKWR